MGYVEKYFTKQELKKGNYFVGNVKKIGIEGNSNLKEDPPILVEICITEGLIFKKTKRTNVLATSLNKEMAKQIKVNDLVYWQAIEEKKSIFLGVIEKVLSLNFNISQGQFEEVSLNFSKVKNDLGKDFDDLTENQKNIVDNMTLNTIKYQIDSRLNKLLEYCNFFEDNENVYLTSNYKDQKKTISWSKTKLCWEINFNSININEMNFLNYEKFRKYFYTDDVEIFYERKNDLVEFLMHGISESTEKILKVKLNDNSNQDIIFTSIEWNNLILYKPNKIEFIRSFTDVKKNQFNTNFKIVIIYPFLEVYSLNEENEKLISKTENIKNLKGFYFKY